MLREDSVINFFFKTSFVFHLITLFNSLTIKKSHVFLILYLFRKLTNTRMAEVLKSSLYSICCKPIIYDSIFIGDHSRSLQALFPIGVSPENTDIFIFESRFETLIKNSDRYYNLTHLYFFFIFYLIYK